jgi:signal transduction histidine kinase
VGTTSEAVDDGAAHGSVGRWRAPAAEHPTRSILEVARSVLAELELDVVLERVLDSAQELTEARYAALGVLNESKTELDRFVTKGVDAETRALIGTLPRGRGVLGTLIEHPQPLRLSNVGAHPHSYGFPHGHPPMRTFLGVPVLVDGEPFGNLYLTEKAGGAEFSQADEDALQLLADFAGVAIDHARRYTDTRQRRDELERTVAALEATIQIARAVGSETNLDVILELVAKRGRALVAARALLIELKHGEELSVAAGAGELPNGVIGRRVPLTDTVAGHVMRTLKTQRLEDELNRSRFDEHDLGRLGVKAHGGMVVPLRFRGTTHGVLVALDPLRGGPAFTADDERLLEAFAASAAIAVATARSVGTDRHRHRLAAAEAERRRWARELHDDTLQSLSAIRLGLAAGARLKGPETLRDGMRWAAEQLDESIAGLRALITDLRPAALDELGVHAALEGLVERASRQGMQIDLSVDPAVDDSHAAERLPSELETALYRIVQEALTNASKHGRATRAVVDVSADADGVGLTVRDDGCGFDPRADTEGFGLLGIRERVELLSGQLAIESEPGRGTALNARFPLERPRESPPGERRAPQRASER